MKSKLLSLILAGAMVASLSGCGSPDSSADASAPSPDVGSASVPTQDVEPAPAPTSDAEPAPAPTSDAEPAPAPTSDAEPAPAPTSDAEPAPAPTSDAEPAPAPTSDAEPAPAPTSDAEPAPAPETEGDADPSLNDLIQLAEYALSQGDVNYDVSVENDEIIVSVWVEGLGYPLSAAVESGFSVEKAVLDNGGEVLVLLERNILELAGAAGYADMPVTLRVLDDRNLEKVLLEISDGEITVFEG